MLIIKNTLLILFILLVIPSYAAIDKYSNEEQRNIIGKLKRLSLEELSNIEIFNPEASSAARKVQKLSDTAAALFVITQEDIRRAGFTSLPEALRMVPGVQVTRINANKWAISVRGLNGLFASKLLVMVDGRTVYTPLRSEVFWDVQDLLIEDVDHIEVIRGPGASLWGANAVNGIINIITKTAKDTQGNLLTTYAGDGDERAIVGLRHGGKLGNNGHYRIYGKFYNHDNFVNKNGEDQQDFWQMKRGGFRADWANKKNNFTIQGDAYEGFVNEIIVPLGDIPLSYKTELNGFNILGRWQKNSVNGNIILQAYYDHTKRQELALGEKRGILDIDFQQSWQRNESQEFIWGLAYRYTEDDIRNSSTWNYNPKRRQDNLFSAFIQSEFKITMNSLTQGEKNTLRLLLGSKFEQNDYSGFEFQPSARLLWIPNDRHSIWAAISRAVRTPSRTDVDASYVIKVDLAKNQFGLPSGPVTVLGIANHNFKSEILMAYELGYRFKPTSNILLDTTIFYNNYNNLRSIEVSTSEKIFLKNTNKMWGEIYGLEMVASWQVFDTWKLIGTYSCLNINLHLPPNAITFFGETGEDDSPDYQINLRSLLTLPHNIELDTALYYVDKVANQNTASYSRFDIRFGWQIDKNLKLSLGARNLFDMRHREFGNSLSGNAILADEVQQAFYLQMQYQF
jgi:iron complex outermembrane receptor protein